MNLSDIFTLRRHKRFMVNLDVTFVETRTGREIESKVHDVSAGGMKIFSEDSFETGELLDIWLILPATEEYTAPPVLIISGKVANCALDAKGHFFDVGVSLKKFEGEGQSIYLDYLERLAGSKTTA